MILALLHLWFLGERKPDDAMILLGSNYVLLSQTGLHLASLHQCLLYLQNVPFIYKTFFFYRQILVANTDADFYTTNAKTLPSVISLEHREICI